MNNSNSAEVLMFEDEAIRAEVLEVWSLVMTTGNKVISHFEAYGYEHMSVVPNPNIHALLVPIRQLEETFDKILGHPNLEYSESRMVINAKQQLLWMELLAAALSNEERDDFDAVLQKIRSQPQI